MGIMDNMTMKHGLHDSSNVNSSVLAFFLLDNSNVDSSKVKFPHKVKPIADLPCGKIDDLGVKTV